MQWLDDFRDRHRHGPLAERFAKIRPYLPPINFITVHYAYFILVGLVFSLILWGTSSPSSLKLSYTDSFYLSMSAISSTGMNTVNISQLSTGQQVILVILMMLGSPILISLWTVLFRRHVFEKRFRAIVKAERERKLRMGSSLGLAGALQNLLSFNKSKSRMSETEHLPGLGTRIQSFPAPASSQPAHAGTSTNFAPTKLGRTEEEPDVEAGRRTWMPPPTTPGLPPKSPGAQSARGVAFVEPPRVPGNPYHGHNQDRHQLVGASAYLAMGGTAEEAIRIGTFLEEKRHNIGRNGQFSNLTLREREYLGGVEYRALEVLVVTVSMYFFLWQLLGAIALGAWLAVNAPEVTAVNAQNPWWAGAFLCVSAFNSNGMFVLDAGTTVFQSGSYFVLIVLIFLLLAGNPAFPAFLRLIVWLLSGLLKYSTKEENYAVWKETFEFILKYPRRVYINMFSSRPTWILTGILAAMTVVDWGMFFLLNIGNAAIESIPRGPRVLDGLFQSVSILAGGFAIVSPSSVYFGLQVLWLVKMYASAYPQSITVRNSNVYEERSLGLYAGESRPDDANEKKPNQTEKTSNAGGRFHLATAGIPAPMFSPLSATSQLSRISTMSRRGVDKVVKAGKEGTAMIGRQIQRRMTGFNGVGVPAAPRRSAYKRQQPGDSPAADRGSGSSSTTASIHSLAGEGEVGPPDLVSQHVRSQLSHDVWWIALAFFLITIIETSHTLADPTTYSLFNILFEIVSAYANNGITIGLPFASYSFSGGWRTGSKLVLVLVMLRGRHRGLPVALDRAVKLPGVDLDEKEDEDAEIRRTLSRSPNLGRSLSHDSRM
ncbi:hypothetical protein VTK56DRAFT_9394 [Thermocarpiscus australiensis]